MQELYPLMAEAEALVLAAPIYYFTLCGQGSGAARDSSLKLYNNSLADIDVSEYIGQQFCLYVRMMGQVVTIINY
jgi:hypothetical protein